MSRRYGGILIKLLWISTLLQVLWPMSAAQAISVGNMTFSMAPENDFAFKLVSNNNMGARLYRVSIVAIDRPGSNEISTRPIDGELLFAPRQLTLSAGEAEYFKFYYHGPKDNHERYYRVSFHEIPTLNHLKSTNNGSGISMEPIIVIDTIFVIRPRQIEFKWNYDPASGTVVNTGNTWFKLLIKPGCDTTEEEGDALYLRPNDIVRLDTLRKPGNHYIVYNEKYIKITDTCEDVVSH